MTTGFSVLSYAGLSMPEYGSLSGLDGFGGDLCSSESIEAPNDETPTATMNPELPMKLPDWVHGAGFGALVVSPRLRAFLAEHVAEIEFFPLRITSKEGELISDEYHLAHLVDHIDCIDMAAAKPKWHFRKKQIVRMEDRKLPLLADRIPANRRLFYASFLPQLPLVRADFGEAIVKEGFTNVRLVDLESALASL